MLGYYFNSLKDKLDKEENSTKSLITDISHQLKTPLASLKMSHELTLSKDLSESERIEFLEQEDKEIAKLENLLAELVNLSRLENHMIQIKPERMSIKKTITEIKKHFSKRNKCIICNSDLSKNIKNIKK